MPCAACSNPLQCDEHCRQAQRVREIVRRAVLRMPRTQLTTTIRQAELERFAGIVMEEMRAAGVMVTVGVDPGSAEGDMTTYRCGDCGWIGATPSNCPRCAGEVHADGVAASPAYRLLVRGEAIQRGDEVLADDTVNWIPLAGWEVGAKWDGALLMPMRRRTAGVEGTPR